MKFFIIYNNSFYYRKDKKRFSLPKCIFGDELKDVFPRIMNGGLKKR